MLNVTQNHYSSSATIVKKSFNTETNYIGIKLIRKSAQDLRKGQTRQNFDTLKGETLIVLVAIMKGRNRL